MKLFDQVAVKSPKYSKFDLSHERKFSMKHGTLTPIYLQEVLPGDSFRLNSEMLIRLAPMKFPVLHRISAYIHYWFVPNRLVWSEWEDFITGGDDGLSAPLFPVIDETNLTTSQAKAGELWDFMGMPPIAGTVNPKMKINALPFRGYATIYNEFYRDQNLQDKIPVTKTGGSLGSAEVTELLKLRYRAWEHDYFTSCLPQAQKGGEVLLPMEADINYKSEASIRMATSSAGYTEGANVQIQQTGFTPPTAGLFGMEGSTARAFGIENIESIDNATTTINDLRKAVRLQEFLEKAMRAGSRYSESIKAYFGVRSSDARLQRPEFLGGGVQPIVVSEVLQTYEGTDPLGKMGGHGISVGNKSGFKKRFEEHGYIIGIMSIIPKSAYGQGIPKTFMKANRYDFAFPEFAQLGEQEVLNKEVFWDETDVNNVWNDLEFGYIPRYSEYKFNNSSVHGQFRPGETLENWTMVRKFENRPALNEEFISSEDATQDIFNVTDPNEDKYFVQIYHNISAIRALPYFGTPTL
ncbi:MAG: major capsid protein [Microviridae sp.]|nr:MAG: major capsid protein [Microviridae sp.]